MKVILISGMAQCVSGDTEFFNGFGWKKISEYKKEDKVLQFNTDNTVSLVTPIDYITNENSNLVRIKNTTFESVLTEDHNVVYYINRYGRNKFYKKTVNEIRNIYNTNNSGFCGKVPATFHYEIGSGKKISDDEMRLKIAIFADGTFPVANQSRFLNCSFNLKKKYKIDRLEYLLNSVGIQYKKYNCKNNFVKFYFHYDNCKHFDETWYDCNPHQFQLIKDEIVLWDGNRRNKYYTNSKFDADFIQFVFTSCGSRTSIVKDDRIGCVLKDQYFKKNITYTVSASSVDKYTLGSRHRTSDTSIFCDYGIGNSYCFTVPSGMLVLRYNDHIFVTGNCGKDTSAFMMKELLENRGKKVLIIHYADNLKLFCKNYLGWDGDKTKEEGRKLLQWFGTDVVRKNHEDTWVDMEVALLKGVKTLYDYVIIPDVRFPNEIYKMSDNFNCITVKVERPNFDNGLTDEQKNHSSEIALKDFPMEYEFINDGKIEKLLTTVKTFLKDIGE